MSVYKFSNRVLKDKFLSNEPLGYKIVSSKCLIK